MVVVSVGMIQLKKITIKFLLASHFSPEINYLYMLSQQCYYRQTDRIESVTKTQENLFYFGDLSIEPLVTSRLICSLTVRTATAQLRIGLTFIEAVLKD